MAVSSHKSESTLKTYANKCPEVKKHQMSDSLSVKIAPKKTKTATTPAATAPKPTFNSSAVELFPVDPENDISDEALTKFLDETEKLLATENAGTGEMSVQPVEPNLEMSVQAAQPVTSVVKNTVNTVNNNIPRLPQIPQMYFPNSNVTINYNFHN